LSLYLSATINIAYDADFFVYFLSEMLREEGKDKMKAECLLKGQ
jgi:hypothetical protein